MRTIGIDLAITGQHQAVSVDEYGEALGRPFRFGTDPLQLDRLLSRTQAGANRNGSFRVIMEPTGLSWLPLASYCIQRGATVYLVNSQRIADLRRYYRKHAKSDRISARVLARLPWTDPDALHPLHLANADYLSGQRWCRQQEQLAEKITAVKNRVQAWERAFWPGLEQVVRELWAPWMRHWRQVYYNPWQLEALERTQLTTFLAEAGADPDQAQKLATGLQEVAHRAVALFGTAQQERCPYVDYATLQEQVLRELRILALYEEEHQHVQRRVQQLYGRLHPSRHLESIRGVGQSGAAVYLFFVGQVERFPLQKNFRGWSGMVPKSDQSGDLEKKGLPITKAGPDLVKKYAYINAEMARQWDPQIAAIY